MYGQETELKFLEKILPFLTKTFIDVGAEKGNFSKWLVERGLKGILIEPLQRYSKPLQDFASRNGCSFLPYAIDDTDKTADFFIALDENGVEKDHFHSLQALDNDPHIASTRIETVTCRSLDSLKNEGKIDGSFGLLKIDTEGNDLRVLQGSRHVKAEMILCEFFTEGMYNGWSEAHPQRLIDHAVQNEYPHCLAIRRKSNYELVSYNPLTFGKKEWGNLFFLREELFSKVKIDVCSFMEEAEIKISDHIQYLTNTCEERLKLIQALHQEAEKRLQLFNPNPNMSSSS
jgi:FkbM family methyltransferase